MQHERGLQSGCGHFGRCDFMHVTIPLRHALLHSKHQELDVGLEQLWRIVAVSGSDLLHWLEDVSIAA